jgi:hypothetical protein
VGKPDPWVTRSKPYLKVIPMAAEPMSQMFQRFTIEMFDLEVKQEKPLKILERCQL